MKGVIGEEIDRFGNQKPVKDSLFTFYIICCLLFVVTFGFLTYSCWVAETMTFGGRYGSPDTTVQGVKAIRHGYFFFTIFMASFSIGVWEYQFRNLICIILTIIWLIGIVLAYQQLGF